MILFCTSRQYAPGLECEQNLTSTPIALAVCCRIHGRSIKRQCSAFAVTDAGDIDSYLMHAIILYSKLHVLFPRPRM